MTNKQVIGMVEMVGEFYRAIGDGEYIGTEKYKNIERKTMRENIFHEELIEFIEASAYKREKLRRKGQLDAICDMFYVAAGNLLENSKSIEQAKQKWTKGGIWENFAPAAHAQPQPVQLHRLRQSHRRHGHRRKNPQRPHRRRRPLPHGRAAKANRHRISPRDVKQPQGETP